LLRQWLFWVLAAVVVLGSCGSGVVAVAFCVVVAVAFWVLAAVVFWVLAVAAF